MISSPRKNIRPASGWVSRISDLARVDLPQPDSPTSARVSPRKASHPRRRPRGFFTPRRVFLDYAPGFQQSPCFPAHKTPPVSKQRTKCPGPTSQSAGEASLQPSPHLPQRGEKRHPEGRRRKSGTLPGMAVSVSPPSSAPPPRPEAPWYKDARERQTGRIPRPAPRSARRT